MDEAGPQGRAVIRSLLEETGIRPSKRLGQHFLADPNTVRRIVDVAGIGNGDQVVEVGAGTGTLTRTLAATGARVVAYEIDSRLAPILEQEVGDGDRVDVRIDDASRLTLDEALPSGEWTMVANLPYNVGTGILLDALRHSLRVVRFVVMVQREVAGRLLAAPGSREYGVPSVITALHAEGEIAFTVPPTVFLPPPDVESAVVALRRRRASPLAGAAIALASAAFGQRRKMLRRSLASTLTDPEGILVAAGLEPEARAEDISPAGFLALAGAVP